MKHEFSRHILRKMSDIKFHQNPSSGSRVFFHADGRTDVTKLSLFSQFCERVKNDSSFGNFILVPGNIHFTTISMSKVLKVSYEKCCISLSVLSLKHRKMGSTCIV
jgi:hypothetical protein